MNCIVRYKNRKMYSTSMKKYLVLPEILREVRSGLEVRVIDHKSKADITTQTLLRALCAESRLGLQALTRFIKEQ